MIPHLRAVLRLPVASLATLVFYAGWLLTRPLGWVAPELGARSHHFVARSWARTLARIVGVSIATRGVPPEPPFFLVSNHLSYLDVIVILARVRGFFVAKAEIAGWPVLGLLASSTGTIFVERARKSDLVRVNDEIERAIAAGRGVIVFPEGTSTSGARVEPFKASMFEGAVRSETPVACASVTYATPAGAPPARQAVCWWGNAPFWRHLYTLLGLPSIQATLAFADEPVRGSDRKVLAREAQRAVSEIFSPTAG